MRKVGSFFSWSEQAEPAITDRIQEIARGLPGAELAGLEARRKTRGSLCRKVATEVENGRDLDGAITEMRDAIRYTFIFEPEYYSERTGNACAALERSDFEMLKFKNSWNSDIYRGINSTWRDPRSGAFFEVQFHTPDSFRAKTDSHPFYDVSRLPGQSVEVMRKADAAGRAITAGVKIPSGATEVSSVRRGRE